MLAWPHISDVQGLCIRSAHMHTRPSDGATLHKAQYTVRSTERYLCHRIRRTAHLSTTWAMMDCVPSGQVCRAPHE